MQVLHDFRTFTLTDGLELGVHADELVETRLELRVVGVDDLRENRRRRLVGLVNDVHVELRRVQTERFVELTAAVIVQVHGDVHGQAEESRPELRFGGVDQLRARLQNRREEVAVTVFVLAPVLKVLEQRVQLLVRVRLQVAVDGDVTPVANLFAQVRGVHDELRLEKRVLAVLGQKPEVERQVEIAHRLVQEPSVTRLVAGHQREDLRHRRGRLLQSAAEFLVQQKPAKLRRARALQKLDENSARLTLDLIRRRLELIVAHEVLLVEILAELVQDGVNLRLVQVRVDLRAEQALHLVEIRRVKSRRQQVFVRRLLDTLAHLLDPSLRVRRRGRADDHGALASRRRTRSRRHLRHRRLHRARAHGERVHVARRGVRWCARKVLRASAFVTASRADGAANARRAVTIVGAYPMRVVPRASASYAQTV